MELTNNSSKDAMTRKKIAEDVSSILASTYSLGLNTQNYHWNVTGPKFHQLHKLFEEQYKQLLPAIDEIAERIRTIGFRAPGSFDEFIKLSLVAQETKEMLPHMMVSKLKEDHSIVARHANDYAKTFSEWGDEATADLMISRVRYHEKTAWIMDSFLQ